MSKYQNNPVQHRPLISPPQDVDHAQAAHLTVDFLIYPTCQAPEKQILSSRLLRHPGRRRVPSAGACTINGNSRGSVFEVAALKVNLDETDLDLRTTMRKMAYLAGQLTTLRASGPPYQNLPGIDAQTVLLFEKMEMMGRINGRVHLCIDPLQANSHPYRAVYRLSMSFFGPL